MCLARRVGTKVLGEVTCMGAGPLDRARIIWVCDAAGMLPRHRHHAQPPLARYACGYIGAQMTVKQLLTEAILHAGAKAHKFMLN